MRVRYEYSPETFFRHRGGKRGAYLRPGVGGVGRYPENQAIINLPNTVEMCTPNTRRPGGVFVPEPPPSGQCHQPAPPQRPWHGCGRQELGLMAGAQRVEGTLFGNGERTGNVDI